MISHLQGTLSAKRPEHAVIDVSGVGFSVTMSARGLAALPSVGETVRIPTHLQVRDDGMVLFGFSGEDERSLFESLTTVTGVGPKMALAVLSTFPPSAFIEAVSAEDVTRICEVPGVGKKVAQRLILELGGRLVPAAPGDPAHGAGSADHLAPAREALLGMGFTGAEADAALSDFEGERSDVSAALRHALSRLGARR